MKKNGLFLLCQVFCLLSMFAQESRDTVQYDEEGAIIRFNTAEPLVYLVFSADEHFEGVPDILQTLHDKRVKAAFFLTGNCLRNTENTVIIRNIVSDGHYLGPHSDAHLLYNDWERRDSLLVDKALFECDLRKNILALETFGVEKQALKWFLPPYEWYNRQIVEWSREMGLQVISFTPGIGTNADYTTPDMSNYRSSEVLINGLWSYEKKYSSGLNGAIILIHPGVHPLRTDKLYTYLDELIDGLRAAGYTFGRLASPGDCAGLSEAEMPKPREGGW